MNILRTILEVFKKPLEDPNQAGGELLNATEMRIVFGNLPPIYDVHAAMLEEFQKVCSLHSELTQIVGFFGFFLLNFVEKNIQSDIRNSFVGLGIGVWMERGLFHWGCLFKARWRPSQSLPTIRQLLRGQQKEVL